MSLKEYLKYLKTPFTVALGMSICFAGCSSKSDFNTPIWGNTLKNKMDMRFSKESEQSKPNIVWIMTDEQRADSLKCYGNKLAKTPNLDLLAQNGVLFANHFVNAPQCVPSRTCILTGTYPHQNGILDNTAATNLNWPEKLNSLPQILEDNGYKTANIGKIHYPKNEKMWQYCNPFIQFGNVATPFRLGEGYDEKEYEVIHRRNQEDIIISGRYPDLNDGKTPATHTTDLAIDWLKEYEDDKAPFLLRVSYVWPHTPVLAPEPFYSLHDIEKMPCDWWTKTPEEILTKYDQKFQKVNNGDEYDITTLKLKRIWATYLGLVTHLDDQMGRLFKMLEDMGKLDNTIIVMTSDHGAMLGEHRQFEKGMFYRQATQVPYIIFWKNRLPEGKVVTDLTEQVDFAPTLLDLAGVDIPYYYVGKPLLNNPDFIQGKEAVFGELYIHDGSKSHTYPYRVSVRTANYSMNVTWKDKYGNIAGEDQRDGFLADLKNDPGETKNVYNDPKYREIRDVLLHRLVDWFNQYKINEYASVQN